MSIPELEESNPKKRRSFFLIVGIVAILMLCCLCAFIWLAWTYGDAVIQSLL